MLSPPQSYGIFWTGPNGFNSTSPNIDNLCGGDYSMFITTSNDTTEFNFTIHEPDSLVMKLIQLMELYVTEVMLLFLLIPMEVFNLTVALE